MRPCLKPLYIAFFLSSLLVCFWLGQTFADDRSVAQENSPNNVAATASATEAAPWLQQGVDHYRSGNVQGAIAHWQTALGLTASNSPTRATTLKYLVQAEQQVGAVDQAIAYLKQLTAYYQQSGNRMQVGRMQTEQAQAYSSLGQQRTAIALLCHDVADRYTLPHPNDACRSESALAIARDTADVTGEIAALGSLGNAYRLHGDYDRALQQLQSALNLATQTHSVPHRIAAFNGLGNTYASLAKRDDRRRQEAQQSADAPAAHALAQTSHQYNSKAIEYFAASLTIARSQHDTLNELRSLLNLIVPLWRGEGRDVKAEGKRQKVEGKKQAVSRQPSAVSGQKIGSREWSETQNSLRLELRSKAKLNTQNSSSLIPHPSSLTSSTALQQAQALLTRLPASREKAYAAIRLSTLTQLVMGSADGERDPGTHCLTAAVPLSVVPLLQQAIAIAQQIGDSQSEAFALGRLGHVYECSQHYEPALALTQQAQLAAANHDSRYLWEWQAGRILQLQHKPNPAIASYELAVKTLQTIRGDLAIASRDFQFDFRDTIEPVYRELTALYLAQATKQQPPAPLQQKESRESIPVPASARTIAKALETIDGLRLAELQNYLGDDCTLNTIAQPVTVIDEKTAVFSSIMLGDRVAIILTLPDANHQFRSQVQWLPASTQTVRTTVNTLRRQLEKRSDLANTYQKTSRQLYDWLIEPFAQDLQQAKIETLVFIQDGILRSLPMAALYDGKRFLVEQYAIASTLSLTLIDPTHLDRHSLRVLGFGLTQASVVEGPTFFPALSHVKAEINRIKTTFPGSKMLFDDAFNLDRLHDELAQKTYPIVHLATHGKFGMDARDTFLVTGGKRGERREGRGERGKERGKGADRPTVNTALKQPDTQNYNEKLTMETLYQMLRGMQQGQVLELLTLTACETAVGSDREALGIAGLSLQAGARSTVASLWQVDDEATAQLITAFYESLKQGLSRAKALQVAQKSWLQQHTGDRHHPGYWAALILVGNWL